MYASRNIRLCTKDCLCLFVCPTGATDTENGQIDKARCISGCRACVDACPSHAIFLVAEEYPEPVPRDPEIAERLLELCAQKVAQQESASALSTELKKTGGGRLARALARSARILAEDCARESGYMTPQCSKTAKLIAEHSGQDDPAVKELYGRLKKLLS